MGSLNIQRGRDLGITNYNEYRKNCGLKPLDSFHNWTGYYRMLFFDFKKYTFI